MEHTMNAFTAAIAAAAAEAPQTITAPPMVPGLTLHIDGDFLAYNAAGNDDCLPGQARINLLDKVDAFRSCSGAENVVVHMTVPGSTKGERFLVATVKPYQAQRKGSLKPKNQPYLQEFLLSYDGTVFRSKLWSTREADDGMAACAHHAIGTAAGYAAIATKDKDMRMFPGLHINWDSRALIRVDPGVYDAGCPEDKQYGLKFFWLQMLMGDPTDNIPGLEHCMDAKDRLVLCGPKTAEKLLAPCTTTDEACRVVMQAYASGYGTGWADRFVEQASLLWMRLGVTAPVDDFYTHAGWSRINAPFADHPVVGEAVARLNKRVTLARAEINKIQSFGGT